jgi:CRP-like cAMP-binding protein
VIQTESDGAARDRTPGPTAVGRTIVELDGRLRERPANRLGSLSPHARVPVLHLPPGRVELDHLLTEGQDSLGLLVLEGLLLVEISAGRAKVGWLVGAEDLLRPWEMSDLALTRNSRWWALRPVRVAVLGTDFARRAALVPQLLSGTIARAARTSHWLLAKSLVTSAPVVEEKLLLLFALLGERWGRVTAEGVVLDLPLTHSRLAVLCGTRRPTVTTALHALESDGLVGRSEGSWLLRRSELEGEPRASCWLQYAEALGLG